MCSLNMSLFENPAHLVDTATGLLVDRLNALEKDVNHCLTDPFAPLPALAYCFSTIDLLGALYKGEASNSARTTSNSRSYMVGMMQYTIDQASVLQKIFRHKIIHLAMPKAVIEYQGMLIGWKYYHQSRKEHLKLTKFPTTQHFAIDTRQGPILTLDYDYEFSIGIKNLQEDIANSVVGRPGYFDALSSSTTLQTNFEKALKEMYDPTN